MRDYCPADCRVLDAAGVVLMLVLAGGRAPPLGMGHGTLVGCSLLTEKVV